MGDEIEQEILKTVKEKRKLENELILSNKNFENQPLNSVRKPDPEDEEEKAYIDSLSQNLLQNFEEHWELKHSITELEEL